MKLLDCIDPRFVMMCSYFMPRRWSEQFNCFFNSLYDTSGEITEKLEAEAIRAENSKYIIRHNRKKLK